MTIHEQDLWLEFAIRCWFALLQFSALVGLYFVGRGARHFTEVK